MAAIGNIRKHYGLLIIIVGVALFAFVLGDFFKSCNSSRPTDVAIVNGEIVTNEDYNKTVEVYLENAKMRKGESLSKEEDFSIRSRALEDMIRNIIMKDQYKKLGLTVSDDELTDLFLGENPSPFVVQQFQNQDGSFNKAAVEEIYNNFHSLDPSVQMNLKDFENYIKEDKLYEKYENLLKKGFYLPTKIAARIYADRNDKVSAEVYAVRYNTIDDATVVLTEEDNKAFYDNNKNKYQTSALRGIEYIIWEINPSQADIEASKKYINNLKEDFARIENVASFVNRYSDAPYNNYDSTWKSRTDVPAELEKVIFDENNGVGFVYGPYESDGYYNMAKIVELDNSSDSLKVRLAIVAHEITASTETYRSTSTEVSRFITENTTAEAFNQAIEEQGLNKRTLSLSTKTGNIPNISSAREIVRWAFDENTEVGEIKEFDLTDMFVVAVLTKSIEEGDMPYEEVTENYEFLVKKEKKGAMLAEQAKAYGTDYQKMIDNLKGEKATVDNITFESRGLGNFGYEDKVIGTVMGMKEGEISEPIVGGNGLYVVKVTKETPSTTTTDFSSIVREYRSKYNNQILNNSYPALKETFEVEDNSILFY